jgi:hypothetical protein
MTDELFTNKQTPVQYWNEIKPEMGATFWMRQMIGQIPHKYVKVLHTYLNR